MFRCDETREENTIKNTEETSREDVEFSQNKEDKIDFDLVTLESESEQIPPNRIASLSVLNDNLENSLSSTLADSQMKNPVKNGLEFTRGFRNIKSCNPDK